MLKELDFNLSASDIFGYFNISNVYSPQIRPLLIQFIDTPRTLAEVLEWGQYAPEIGYYQNDVVMQHDYLTMPEADDQMGLTIGRSIWTPELKKHNRTDRYSILIMGDGTGKLTHDCLRGVPHDLFRKIEITLVDRTQHLLDTQSNNLQPARDRGAILNTVLSDAYEYSAQAVQYGRKFDYIQHNELLDAMPMRVLRKYNGEVQEMYVVSSEDNIVLFWGPVENAPAENYFLNIFSPYVGSRPACYQPSVLAMLQLHTDLLNTQGKMLFFDYFKNGPTDINDIENCGWDLAPKIYGEGRLATKYKERGVIASLQSLGMADITLRVDLQPIKHLLSERGHIEVENQQNFHASLVSGIKDKAHFFTRMGYRNFSAVQFTKA